MNIQEKASLYLYLMCRYDDFFKRIPKDDALQEIILAILEKENDKFSKQINHARRNLYLQWKRLPLLTSEMSQGEAFEKMNIDWASEIIDYYEITNYQSTIEKFGLENSIRLRKALSEICPKPELASKKHGDYKKVYIEGVATTSEIILKYAINRITAWRALKRGYFYQLT